MKEDEKISRVDFNATKFYVVGFEGAESSTVCFDTDDPTKRLQLMFENDKGNFLGTLASVSDIYDSVVLKNKKPLSVEDVAKDVLENRYLTKEEKEMLYSYKPQVSDNTAEIPKRVRKSMSKIEAFSSSIKQRFSRYKNC